MPTARFSIGPLVDETNFCSAPNRRVARINLTAGELGPRCSHYRVGTYNTRAWGREKERERVMRVTIFGRRRLRYTTCVVVISLYITAPEKIPRHWIIARESKTRLTCQQLVQCIYIPVYTRVETRARTCADVYVAAGDRSSQDPSVFGK